MVDLPPRWQRMSETKRDVLLAIAVDGPMIGAEVHNALDCKTSPNIYNALDSLREDGLVAGTETESKRESVRNALTTEGLGLVYQSVVEPAMEIDTGEEPEVSLNG